MPTAIAIRCDNETGAPIRRLWERFGAFEAAMIRKLLRETRLPVFGALAPHTDQ